ncbi:MAG: ketopantoate reductase family protein [Ruminococcus sp.]|nr:ketopantoate reductase family protein [Ruminococcus sp.]
MRLLIYGAGVIGCLYAALFNEAGYDTTLYARGKRLETLNNVGLLYEVKGEIHKSNVKVIEKLTDDDCYEYIFLTVKENQVYSALKELSNNNSPNIVTMVNTLEEYCAWEEICGRGRILPAFPGAGGSFEGDVLKADLTPWIIQPTTFGEISGKKTERLLKLEVLFKQSHIPYQIVKDMHEWQLCHLAMVVPIADAYYEANNPKKAGCERNVMNKTARRMKSNFCTLHRLGIKLSPKKMNLFRFFPIPVLSIGLSIVFQSDFGKTFMYQHSMNAPDEMKQLHKKFYSYIKDKIDR